MADFIQTTSVTKNLDQEVHVTTRDKVELALRRVLPRYSSTEQLVAALTTFVALMGALLAAEFQPFLGVPGDVWLGLFSAGALASLVWTLFELTRWLKRPRLTDVVDEVLRSSDRVT